MLILQIATLKDAVRASIVLVMMHQCNESLSQTAPLQKIGAKEVP